MPERKALWRVREPFDRLSAPWRFLQNGEEKLAGLLTVDLHAGTIDFRGAKGRLILPGLVRACGNRLQLCISLERVERPETFTATKGSRQSVTTIQRKRWTPRREHAHLWYSEHGKDCGKGYGAGVRCSDFYTRPRPLSKPTTPPEGHHGTRKPLFSRGSLHLPPLRSVALPTELCLRSRLKSRSP
jgi:hypothetical protein